MKASEISSTQRLLGELIAIPSVNPAFGEDHAAGERNLAEYLAGLAKKAGLAAELQEVLPERPNLLIRLPSRGKTRHRVILAPHLDTVGAPGDPADLFRPVHRNGRIYGRGACDTKGSVAAMFMAVLRVAASGPRPEMTEIVFAGLADEENAQAGSRALAAKGLSADLAIVGEPTRLKVVTAHKGDVWLRLETQGKPAHGARPELGKNAVHEMAKVVDLLETRYAEQLRKRTHPLLGRATINVGSIRGGTQPNIVPAECSITIDRRTLPGENETTVRREIKTLLRQHGLKAALASARHAPCVPLETRTDEPFVRKFLQCARQQTPIGVDYFCDAAVLAAGGIPSVVFGPGDIRQAHTAAEWIARASLDSAVKLLERFLRSLP